MTSAPLIGLYSPAPGSGKSTLSQALGGFGFQTVKFAGPLKDMVRALLRAAGCPEELIERYVDGDLKEVPCPYLAGRTSRYTQQTIGTEWGRELMSPTFWLDTAMNRAQALREAGKPVVFDDMRFTNEADGIRAAGGLLVRITRPGLVYETKHASESALNGYAFDLDIVNDAPSAEAFMAQWGPRLEAIAYGKSELCR